MINTQTIQKLRQQTGAGIMDIKKALEGANGDETKALEVLRKMGQKKAAKKQATRKTKDGVIGSYIHANAKVAALVVLSCETDFVAKNEKFKNLAHDIAMQVAAMSPENTSDLLNQNFIKDESKTIQDIINDITAKLGEKIEVNQIVKLAI
ncbi:translation elongation factor Ts [Candidatus Parcubacteria bacterium]|nr:translation elongation factor Ts [Patescibacteria group bacterium]MCG2686790.1 translation elongation factor Ts [Candidatus Parcubacteria bacterium]